MAETNLEIQILQIDEDLQAETDQQLEAEVNDTQLTEAGSTEIKKKYKYQQNQEAATKKKRSNRKTCCVPKCHKRYKNGVSFHKLPHRHEIIRRRKWLKYLKLRRDISDTSTVCSDHFDPSQFRGKFTLSV
jgi:murein L,D-transpeptidase YcbB/YkuD